MNKDAIIEFIKKNLLSLICALVAILAVVAIFYPYGGIRDDQQQRANLIANNYSALAEFSKTRHLPVTDPSKSQADAGELAIFPNATVIAAAEKIDAKLIDQSTRALKFVKTLSSDDHVQLIPALLPDVQSQPAALKFAEVYTKVLSSDPTITGVGEPDAKPPVNPDPTLANFKAMNLQNDILHGSMPPSPKEIEDAKADLYNRVYKVQIYFRDGQPVNADDIRAQFETAAASLPDTLKAKVARNFKIYVEPHAFELNPLISVNIAPAATDIWYAQNSLWIQQDIAKAIADANLHSSNILDAQVKHLISLQVAPPPMDTFPPASADPSAPAGAGNMPSPATETQPLPVAYSVSPTGRASNGMYDVIHFSLLIDVDASHLNDVIESFSKGRLITIYRQDLYALDTSQLASQGYLYGDNRVVRLSLQGEELFLRSWTTPWMPDRIKQALGLMPVPGGTVPGAMPGMSPGMPNGYPGYPAPPGQGMMMPPGQPR
jgi:hypothetical protein